MGMQGWCDSAGLSSQFGRCHICTFVPAVCSERSIGIAFQRAIVAADIWFVILFDLFLRGIAGCGKSPKVALHSNPAPPHEKHNRKDITDYLRDTFRKHLVSSRCEKLQLCDSRRKSKTVLDTRQENQWSSKNELESKFSIIQHTTRTGEPKVCESQNEAAYFNRNKGHYINSRVSRILGRNNGDSLDITRDISGRGSKRCFRSRVLGK